MESFSRGSITALRRTDHCCSCAVLIVFAGLVLSFATRPANAQSGAKITGTVAPPDGSIPISDFRVTLYGTDQILERVPGKDGQFEFDDLAPGTYTVSASNATYGSQAFEESATFQIHVDRADIDFGLLPLALTQLFCEAANPPTYKPDPTDGGRVVGRLSLYPEIPLPEKSLTKARISLHALTGTTRHVTVRPNVRGNFEIKNVPPGRYLLRAERAGYSESEITLWVARKSVTQVRIEIRNLNNPVACQ